MPNAHAHLIFGKLFLEPLGDKNRRFLEPLGDKNRRFLENYKITDFNTVNNNKKMINKIINNIDLDNFYFGCIIPDINHISKLERRITHFYDNNVFEFFEPKNRVEYSFCLGYGLHIKIDNLWKYNIRLKYNISLEENLKIYDYLDYFLKKKYDIDYNYFKKHILKGNCDLLKKLNINKKLCEEWKKRCINDNFVIFLSPLNVF
ncbi:conserved hypothetical protein [Methanococcus aeolicus Nankai-3]|uniref:Uncharacterized protein n=1 Tax=Methanococcus aeolicus (strain ATCC BAA-1280 / DSM 17508 / OCM 812 / Nankai-3) TaxID=419665 RepID=A6UTV3_META3|nr:hypothetical protein [Methanococcus aeolicus]ABR55925.1 conserved hypothetical protein [Methanococcus aeolicus Nankai-3]